MTAGDVEVIKGNANAHLATSFDDVDDELKIDAHPVARATANDTVGTYSFWFLPDNITGTYGLIGLGDAAGGANEEFLIEQAANDIRVYGRTHAAAGFDFITTTACVVAYEWMHITVVQDGVKPRIYINGLLVAATETVATNTDDWFDEWANLDEGRIGCQTNDGAESNFLGGAMGPVKYWSVDLYADEVYREFQGKSTQSTETGRQAIITAALEEYWAWDGVLTSSGGDATTAVVVAEAYLSGHTSEWSRKVETRGYTHANDKMNTYKDGSNNVTIVVQGA